MTRFRFPLVPLAKLFRNFKADIVHTRGWSAVDAIFAAKLARVSGIIHGEHGRDATDPEGKNVKRNVIRRVFSPLVDRFITVSDDLRLWLTEMVGIPQRKVVTIHNGVDTQKFAPLRAQSAERMAQSADRLSTLCALRQTLGLPVDGVLIGTVGRLDPVKDHASLLRAFVPLARASEEAHLVIVGEGSMRRAIESEIRGLNIGENVHLLGERHDVPEVLKSFDIFALTSIAEGISNTILEAMASGLPVVATRVGGNPELVDDGITGQLIAPRDVSALTSALKTYLHDSQLRQEHGRAGRARAVENFSLERMAQQYAELYRSTGGR